MRNIAEQGITTFVVFILLMVVCTKLCADTFYVGQAGTPSGDYFTDIQSAVDAAVDGDVVLVSNGVYDAGARITPGHVCSNRVVITNSITVQSVSGAESTVIHGRGPNGDTAVRGVYMSAGILDGFTISNGHTVAGGNADYDNNGGGINMYGGNAVVSNCIISENSISWPGVGGGVYGGTVANSRISDNYSDNRGGGTEHCIVNNSIITGNTASDNGGGTSYGTINNCLIYDNLSNDGGGGCFNSALNNCTVAGNRSAFVGGGTAWCTVKNSIVWGNTAPQSNNYYSGTMEYSCTRPRPSNNGNISINPQFIPSAGFRLQLTSPCINAGTNAYASLPVDLDGTMRIVAGTVDMGCYEYPFPTISITNYPPVVAYPQTTADISGTNLNIGGQLGIVSDRHPETTNYFAQGFSVTVDDIEHGNNTIEIFGTNVFGYLTNTCVTIHRETFAEIHPFIQVTNTPAIISYYHDSAEISGTNLNIAGKLGIVNDRDNATTNYFEPGFHVAASNLAHGDNSITIFGTNIYGFATNDIVSIHRKTLDEILPFIKITNAPAVVLYHQEEAEVTGTNAHIAGFMHWVNSRHPEAFNVIVPGFATAINNLEHGDNIITISGTNIYGHATNDVVTIHRKTLSEAGPQIATNALIFPFAGSELLEESLTNITWHVDRITDETDGTNVIITKISVLAATTTNEVATVTNNVSNLIGEIPWFVPGTLAGSTTYYVMQFEVVNSQSLTNSLIFRDNEFTIIPEPMAAWFVFVLLAWYTRKRGANRY